MNIPEKHKQNLIEAHEQCAQIIRRCGKIPEPLETAIVAEEHRWFWKPKHVGFILIAESHVYTNKNEIQVKIIPNRLPKEVPKSIPLNFVKLVYCFGYGESNILDRPERIENNPGTKDYDNLFKMCVGLRNESIYGSRLQQKAELLKAFKEQGFWLLDASCHACSMGKRKRLSPEIVQSIVPISWRKYVKPIIEENQIDKGCVWIIGKGLHSMLRAQDYFVSDINWIYQPNAYFKNPHKYDEKRKREEHLLKAIDQYRTGKQQSTINVTVGETSTEGGPQKRDLTGIQGRVISEKQAQFAQFVRELKQKGVTGREYREKIMQWKKERAK